MNQPDFVVKCYNKQDLAQMYFPDITVRASVNKLRRWMRRCQPLMDEILSTDFHPPVSYTHLTLPTKLEV